MPSSSRQVGANRLLPPSKLYGSRWGSTTAGACASTHHHPAEPTAQPGRIVLHSPTTLPHQTSTRPPLTAPFHQPRIVFLHYKPTSGLNFFLHRLGLRRCGGGGSAAHCDAQPRTLLFCRHHSSITPRCNRAPGHTPHVVVWLESGFYCSIAQKKSPKLPLRRTGACRALSNPRSFRYRQTHTTTTRSNLHLGRPHYGIERFNWRTVWHWSRPPPPLRAAAPGTNLPGGGSCCSGNSHFESGSPLA